MLTNEMKAIMEEGARLLLVDDEQKILNTLERLLMSEGFEITTAISAKDALILLKEQEFDLIISDMRMPEMNGAAFLKIAAETYPDTRRILLTGFAELDSAITAINEGKIDFYLAKPWNNDQLFSAIQSALEIRQLKLDNQSLLIRLAKANKKLAGLNESLEEEVCQQEQDIKAQYEKIKRMHESSIDVFTNLIELLEGENKGLGKTVAKLAKETAKKMALPQSEVEDIYLASLLHGIGKIGMNPTLLSKPYEYFNQEDKESFIQYPTLGALTLSSYEALSPVATIIASHREYVDGSGYPNHLSSQDIPMGAKIVCCSLDFYLLRKGLLLKKQHSTKEAIDYLQLKDKVLYDSKVIIALKESIDKIDVAIVSANEKLLPSNELREGMTLSRDLKTATNILLLPKGQVLTQTQVEKMWHIQPIQAFIKID